MRNFKELEVWKDGRVLVKEVYLLTKSLPEEEKFGLTSQIKRCSISITANIAEGSAKDSQKDFSRFLQISLGSSFELESHLILCQDLDIIDMIKSTICLDNVTKLQRRIASFIKYVKTQK
jgi:four helix bundle protein